jgi:hypothetical protein
VIAAVVAGALVLLAAAIAGGTVLLGTRAEILALAERVEQLEWKAKFLEDAWRNLEIDKSSLRGDISELEKDTAEIAEHLYGLFAVDSRGQTPDCVVRRYFDAWMRGDWAAEFACMGRVDEEVTLAAYRKARQECAWELLEYRIDGCVMFGPDRAKVTATQRSRPNPTTAASLFEGEGYWCVKEGGVWRILWPDYPQAPA